MSPRRPADRHFLVYMALIIAVAALAWALLRAWNTAQDHRQDGAPAPTAAEASL